jgi:hypothetical protein
MAAWNPMYQRACAELVTTHEHSARMLARPRFVSVRIVGMKCVKHIIHWNPFPDIGPLVAIFWDDLFLQRA